MLLKKLKTSLKERGVFGTLTFTAKTLQTAYNRYVDLRFDQKYGTDTRGMVEVEDLQTNLVTQRYATRYQATPKKIFDKMMDLVSIKFDEFVFVDFGSGKGKVLLFASKFPFQKIIGVEFSKKLHKVAKQNVDLFLARTGRTNNFELHCMDVTQFILPRQKTVLFLYNPFQETVMKAILKNLAILYAENPLEFIILYYNPECAKTFSEFGFLRLVEENSTYHIYTTS